MRASCSVIRPVAALIKNTITLILGLCIIFNYISCTDAAAQAEGYEELDNPVGIRLDAPVKNDPAAPQVLLALTEGSFDLTWGVTSYLNGLDRNNYQDDMGIIFIDENGLPHNLIITKKHMPLIREISLVLPHDDLKRTDNSESNIKTDNVAKTKPLNASEPTAILLFGFGLLWVARWGKKKYNQEGCTSPVWDRLFGSVLQGKTSRATNCVHGSGVHRKPEA
jgi:hypothetical protein